VSRQYKVNKKVPFIESKIPLKKMATSTNNKNDNADDEWIQWIKDGIAKISNKYINYHDYNEFQNIECIGNGVFGNVYRANYKNSNTIVALKSLKNGKDFIKEIVNEVFIIIITI
jgi:hypothetical protein